MSFAFNRGVGSKKKFGGGVVAVQQLPLPEKKFGLRGQKFEFRAFYSPLTQRTATFPRLSDPQGFRFRLFYASGSIGPEGGAGGTLFFTPKKKDWSRHHHNSMNAHVFGTLNIRT